jgi:hypothetical protein
MKKFSNYISNKELLNNALSLNEATIPPAGTVFDSYSNDKILADIMGSYGALPGFSIKKVKGAVPQGDIPIYGEKYYASQGPLGSDPEAALKNIGIPGYTVLKSSLDFAKNTTTWVIAKQFGTQWLGTHFINKYNENNSLETKWLTPERMGLNKGTPMTSKQIVNQTKTALTNFKGLTDAVKLKLFDTINLVSAKGKSYFKGGGNAKLPTRHQTSVIDIVSAGLTTPELKTISKDFGEILSAVWACNNIGYKQIIFPSASNEALVDFYGLATGQPQMPVSVKSGSGASTSMKNLTDPIIKLLSDPAFGDNFTRDEIDIIYYYLILITSSDTMNGIIKMHQTLKTESIKALENATGFKGKQMTATALSGWLSSRGNSKEVQNDLKDFYNATSSYPESASWKKYDKKSLKKQEGIIIGPMGIDLIAIMNDNPTIKNTLTKCARSIVLLQMNVDVKAKTMSFKRGAFKDFSFKFSWGGGATNPHRNKFGFKAITLG